MSDYYHSIEEDLSLGMVKTDRVLKHVQNQRARIEGLEAEIKALVEATDYARNRLEMVASDAWNVDGRDLKRNLQGVFAEYDIALAKARGEQK